MRSRRLVRFGPACLLAAACAGLAAACGSSITGLVGNLNHGNSAGISVLAGEPADYTGFLENRTGQVIVLESARLLPLPGFATPRLVHVTIEAGRDFAVAARDWPPSGGDYHLHPFVGTRVASGGRVRILYSVLATELGEYGDAGIRVTIRASGDTGSVTVQSVAGTCVVPSSDAECTASFQQRIAKAAG